MDSSVYVYVEDVRGEGLQPVLDRVAGYGVAGVTVAAAYHRTRDVTPHGSSRVTIRRDGVHFLPPEDLFGGLRLVPPVQEGPRRSRWPRSAGPPPSAGSGCTAGPSSCTASPSATPIPT
nr:hypothetical protein GCM10020093_095550 [Planobispora longispora]